MESPLPAAWNSRTMVEEHLLFPGHLLVLGGPSFLEVKAQIILQFHSIVHKYRFIFVKNVSWHEKSPTDYLEESFAMGTSSVRAYHSSAAALSKAQSKEALPFRRANTSRGRIRIRAAVSPGTQNKTLITQLYIRAVREIFHNYVLGDIIGKKVERISMHKNLQMYRVM